MRCDARPTRRRCTATGWGESIRSGASRSEIAGAEEAALSTTGVVGEGEWLAREDRRFQAILDAIPAPMFFKDIEGVYRGCNAAFERYLGRPRAEIVGRTVYDVAPGDLADVYREADRSLMRDGGTQVYETSVPWADGARRRVVFHKSVIRDARGATIGLAGAMIDVTDKRLAEDQLRRALDAVQRSEAAFRNLIESSPEMVLIHRAGMILYANPTLLGAVGRTAAELEGARVADLIHPEDRDAAAGRFDATGPLPVVEGRLLTTSGSVRRLEVVSTDLEIDGAPARVVFGRDVTHRREMEARLASADRLASLGTVAAGVAHELNNPLSYVMANLAFAVDALRRTAGAGPDRATTDALAALDEARLGAERMAVIVRDLRTLSRTDEGPRGAVPLQEALRYASNLAAAEIRRRARLRWDVPDGLHALGNEARLGQVFLNLLVNAAHALPDAAPDVHEIRISARALPGDRVAVEIADTGSGIAPEVRPRIFDPFFTTKPEGVGTGLGLWVCHNIVTAHGGAIEVESKPGAGSVFRVILPATSGPQPHVRTRASGAPITE